MFRTASRNAQRRRENVSPKSKEGPVRKPPQGPSKSKRKNPAKIKNAEALRAETQRKRQQRRLENAQKKVNRDFSQRLLTTPRPELSKPAKTRRKGARSKGLRVWQG